MHGLKKTDCNTKIENTTPDDGCLLTKSALNTKATKIANKIPNHNRFITIPEFNRSTKINFDTIMKEAVTKSVFDVVLQHANKNHREIKNFKGLI